MANKNELDVINGSGKQLFLELAGMIESTQTHLHKIASGETVFLFWRLGKRINEDILNNARAEYGKQIVNNMGQKLAAKYGASFEVRNLRRMMQLAEQFPSFEIIAPMASQLKWSHFVEILPLQKEEAKIFYLTEVANVYGSRSYLRDLIKRKAYERREISDNQLTDRSLIPKGTFKDPYLFDVLGLKDEYLESDLEDAVLRELEKFILEFGKGFAFVDRQKRMIIGGKDYNLDLLFYNRELRRLVAIELKIRKFEPQDKGQMELYLNWLNRYERKTGEETPIGIILCSDADREVVELMQMDKDGIAVAEYWTTVPPKDEFEQKIQMILTETKERLEARKLLATDEIVES